MINELTQKLESLGYTLPNCDLLEWALGELPEMWVSLRKDTSISRIDGKHYTSWTAQHKSYLRSDGYEEKIHTEVADNPTTAALKLLITLKEEGIV